VTEPILCPSVEETQQLAARLAAQLHGGECIALHGELGAGKTQFVRGLVAGLGGDPRTVSSPTYVLLHLYDSARLPIFHLDAYRIGGPEDFEAIGFSELLEQNGVVVVEWASRVQALLPENCIHVTLETLDENTRAVQISGIDL
jgi:tRNA threonylcarbamoyladenosine biosynthesis protein TsaE